MNIRRDTFKKIVGISSVMALAPTSWTKPVLSSVILPVHAQTSNNIDLISDDVIEGNAGEVIFFLDAVINQSSSNVQFLIRVQADLSQFNFNNGPLLSFVRLSTASGDSFLSQGSVCGPNEELATIESGINTLELNFNLEKDKTYTELLLQFYPIDCSPSTTGFFRFGVNVLS